MQPAEEPLVTQLMYQLYAESGKGHDLPVAHPPQTFAHLQVNPTAGVVWVVAAENKLLGYALLIPYWSNEYGGNVLHLDELYVQPENRGQGIGKALIEHLATERPFGAVAFKLDVWPENQRAIALYQTLGFTDYPYRVLVWSLV